jgi:hypothetical protein
VHRIYALDTVGNVQVGVGRDTLFECTGSDILAAIARAKGGSLTACQGFIVQCEASAGAWWADVRFDAGGHRVPLFRVIPASAGEGRAAWYRLLDKRWHVQDTLTPDGDKRRWYRVLSEGAARAVTVSFVVGRP